MDLGRPSSDPLSEEVAAEDALSAWGNYESQDFEDLEKHPSQTHIPIFSILSYLRTPMFPRM
ncbi:hypothetical protein CR513_37488, partial [Mucuna pruriens]